MNFLFYTFATLMVVICILLMLLILIQKGRGGGLASAFGGAGGNTAFGAKTGDVLTWATSIVFGVLLVVAVITSLLSESVHQRAVQVQTAAEVGAQSESALEPQAPLAPDTLPQEPVDTAEALEQTPPAAADPPPAANEPMITPEEAN